MYVSCYRYAYFDGLGTKIMLLKTAKKIEAERSHRLEMDSSLKKWGKNNKMKIFKWRCLHIYWKNAKERLGGFQFVFLFSIKIYPNREKTTSIIGLPSAGDFAWILNICKVTDKGSALSRSLRNIGGNAGRGGCEIPTRFSTVINHVVSFVRQLRVGARRWEQRKGLKNMHSVMLWVNFW